MLSAADMVEKEARQRFRKLREAKEVTQPCLWASHVTPHTEFVPADWYFLTQCQSGKTSLQRKMDGAPMLYQTVKLIRHS